MKDANTLIEYGAPIDPQTMVTPPDATELELEAGHPGEKDDAYIRRRKELFALCRKHRLERLGPPFIDYTPEETRIWREVSPKLDELHQKHACRIYLEAKRELAITRDVIPQLRHLSERVQRETKMHLVPAEGALPYRTFYEYIAQRGFPVTQFIRHGSHPEFTPEPDMIHDCLGHVPPLMNQDYAELLALVGKAVATTSKGDQVLALKRFSWFSIEFGLIEEAGATKVFGAGILSSTGEIPYSLFSKEVTRRPFVTDVVISTDYDPSRMQNNLFIAPSLPFLRRELEGLVRRFGIAISPRETVMPLTTLNEIESRIPMLTRDEQLLLIERLAKELRRNGKRRDWDADLAAMAADPDIQREIRAIEAEFAQTESDGLEGM